MLVDVLLQLRKKDERFEPVYRTVLRRARRYAEVLERLIAPDGTFPSAFAARRLTALAALHVLAQMAPGFTNCPEAVKPAQKAS